MKIRNVILATATAAALAMSGTALAAEKGKKGMKGEKSAMKEAVKEHKQALKSYDSNGDGVISQEEYLSGQKQAFMKFDADSNGSLDKKEQAALAKGWSKKG